MTKESGKLVISLDFELLWGVFDKVNFREKELYFQNTRKVIPEILNIFEEAGIAATWATVGVLFNKNWEDFAQNIPEFLPEYHNMSLSAYEYAKSNMNEIDEYFCFANSLIEQIRKTQKQEIGTHTYSHYYCLEPGQNEKSFKADLKKNIKLAEQAGINLQSLVFPRNQFNTDYLSVCNELGIRTVRSNPTNWYWQSDSKDTILNKIFRTGDAYLGLNDKPYPIDSVGSGKNLPVEQKASRLLRPYSDSFLNKLKIQRIKKEMLYAARNNQIYHLWWHPHNFGEHPEESIEDLKSNCRVLQVL